MKLKYIIPPIGIGVAYLLYISGKSLLYDFSLESAFKGLEMDFGSKSLEKDLIQEDWGLMTG